MPSSAEQVLIVGAGPTGLAAALFLAERGVKARLIDRAKGPATTSRAQVVNPRSFDLLKATGVAATMMAEARPVQGVRFSEHWRPLVKLEFANLPSLVSHGGVAASEDGSSPGGCLGSPWLEG